MCEYSLPRGQGAPLPYLRHQPLGRYSTGDPILLILYTNYRHSYLTAGVPPSGIFVINPSKSTNILIVDQNYRDSYLAAGVPPSGIFVINPSGEIRKGSHTSTISIGSLIYLRV